MAKLLKKITALADYCWTGVWRDPGKSRRVKIIKIANLSVRTFIDSDLQGRSAALTFNTLLAIVPAFALLFAVGRGFNLQDIITSELYKFFPAQHEALAKAMGFVDSYLRQASQGVFVGVGIVFLLWTLISLLSNIEDAFNGLWGIKEGRTWTKKITDYTAICLMVPVLMVCSAGINIFMSTMFDTLFGHTIISPVASTLLDCAPFVLTCMAFTLSFLLIPNTHVRFKYAAISGLVCGVAFQLVQMLFISGQLYVAKYNAIYGSFAFLPLLLIWLQISWLILLAGCTMTYAMQNIFHYTFTETVTGISPLYMRKLTIVTAAIVAARFREGKEPLTAGQMSEAYDLPIRLLHEIIGALHDGGVVYYVVRAKEKPLGIAPAVNLDSYTIGDLLRVLDDRGHHDFIPGFAERYSKALHVADAIAEAEYTAASRTLLRDVPLPKSI